MPLAQRVVPALPFQPALNARQTQAQAHLYSDVDNLLNTPRQNTNLV
jgi:hypothetical protein